MMTPNQMVQMSEEQRVRQRRIAEASDYYKAVFGYRPHCYTDEERLVAWQAASDRMQVLKSTPEGRAALRADGWVLNDSPNP